MLYQLHKTDFFDKKFNKLIPIEKQNDVKRRIEKLKMNPYVGKPLGSKYFREIKLDKFRVYFKIYEEKILILLLTVSDKKHQQETIDDLNETKIGEKYIKNLKENLI